MQEVKTRAEKRDPYFYSASRYTNPAAFYKDFLHLSGILFWIASTQPWINKQARSSLSVKVMGLISSLPSGSGQLSSN